MKSPFTLTSIVDYGTCGDDHLAGEARFSDGKRYRFVIDRPLLHDPLRFGEPCVKNMALPNGFYDKPHHGETECQERWAWRKDGCIFPNRAALIMAAYPEYLAKAKVEKERKDAAEEAKRKKANEAFFKQKALMEAAPDLLDALKELLANGDSLSDPVSRRQAQDKALVAIAKATTIKTS